MKNDECSPEKNQEMMEAALHTFEKAIRQHTGELSVPLIPTFYECSWAERSYTTVLETTEEMRNPWRTVHGGVIANVADTCMGVLIYCCNGQKKNCTVSLQISYLRPARIGPKLVIRSTLSGENKDLQFAKCVMWNEDAPDRPVATAEGVYFSYD